MLFVPNDQLQIVTNFKAINGNKSLIQPIIGATFGLCKDVKKTQMGPTFFCTAFHTNIYVCTYVYNQTTSKLFLQKIVKVMIAD